MEQALATAPGEPRAIASMAPGRSGLVRGASRVARSGGGMPILSAIALLGSTEVLRSFANNLTDALVSMARGDLAASSLHNQRLFA